MINELMLRDYQDVARERIYQSWGSGHRAVICKMPTGSGKTALAGSVIKMELAIGNRVAFIVPFLSLIDQTVTRFRGYGIEDIGVIQGQHPLHNPDASVLVCSAQTLIRRSFPEVGCVIVDEAHKKFRDLETWIGQQDRVLGLTATPWAKGMAKIWHDLICPVTINQLTESGYLVPVKALVPPARPDLSGVKSRRYDWGLDYVQSQLSERMRETELVGDIVGTWRQESDCTKTLIFAVDRAHARSLQDEIRANDLECGYVDAYTEREERNRLSQLLMDGEINAIVNVATMTTGVDFDVRTIVLARPTRSKMLYQQIVGRGLRPAEGKDYLLLLDHSPSTLSLGLVGEIDEQGDYLDETNYLRRLEEKEEPKRRECAKCKAVQPKRVMECPFCGHVVERLVQTKAPIKVDGELQPYRCADEHDQDLLLFYMELRRFGENHGYKPGWAWHKFKERTKVCPADAWTKEYVWIFEFQIRAETLSWIKSAQIRWAKRKVA